MHVSLGGTVRRDNRACITSGRGCPDAGPRDIPTLPAGASPTASRTRWAQAQGSTERGPIAGGGDKAGHFIGPEAGPAYLGGMAQPARIRVLVGADQPIVREGIVHVLEASGLEVIGAS